MPRNAAHPNAAGLTTILILIAASAAFAEDKPRPSANSATEAGRPSRRIVVSIPDRKLALLEGDRIVRIYDTAVGATKSPSPSGTFAVATRIPEPTYYAPGKVILPGSTNPLGTRWLGLTLQGFGIHGTNVSSSIGRAASHGCIRMRNRDVEELFDLVRVGDVVELHARYSDQLARIFVPNRGANPEMAQVATATTSTTGLD